MRTYSHGCCLSTAAPGSCRRRRSRWARAGDVARGVGVGRLLAVELSATMWLPCIVVVEPHLVPIRLHGECACGNAVGLEWRCDMPWACLLTVASRTMHMHTHMRPWGWGRGGEVAARTRRERVRGSRQGMCRSTTHFTTAHAIKSRHASHFQTIRSYVHNKQDQAKHAHEPWPWPLCATGTRE